MTAPASRTPVPLTPSLADVASRPRLVVLGGAAGLTTHALPARGQITIGRDPACEIRIDEPSLSRRRNGGDEDGDYLTDFSDPDCYAPAFAAAGADDLNANRQRLLERYAQRKGISTCAAWSGWSIDQREVFATMTDRLQRSTHSQTGRSFLSHLDDLYGVVGCNGTSCGGEDYNRAYFSMAPTLATTVRQIAALQPAATLSDPRTTVWKRSCDPNPHEPFSNGANGGSIDAHNGGSLTSPCTGASGSYPANISP